MGHESGGHGTVERGETDGIDDFPLGDGLGQGDELDRGPLPCFEHVEIVDEHLTDAIAHLDGAEPVPDVALAAQRSGRHRPPHGLADVERVAPRGLEDVPRGVDDDVATEGFTEESGDLLAGQRSEVDPFDHVVAPQGRQRGRHRTGRGAAQGEEQHDLPGATPVRQVGGTDLVQQVGVVDLHDRDRTGGAGPGSRPTEEMLELRSSMARGVEESCRCLCVNLSNT